MSYQAPCSRGCTKRKTDLFSLFLAASFCRKRPFYTAGAAQIFQPWYNGAVMANKKSDKNPERDLLAQALLIGFGLMDVTKKKAKTNLEEFKKRKNINDKDAEKAAKDFLRLMEKGKKDAKKILREQVEKIIEDIGRENGESSAAGKKKKNKSNGKKK
jgi:polyhydroxyalkanoate synthesis regulator phasin